jgi:hypothetical protein
MTKALPKLMFPSSAPQASETCPSPDDNRSVIFPGGNDELLDGEAQISQIDPPFSAVDDDDEVDHDNGNQPSITHQLQISPQRPRPTVQFFASPNLKGDTEPGPAPNFSSSTAHWQQDSLLRSLAREIAREVRLELETPLRADVQGVRLDIVRLGRALRAEMRAGLAALAEEVRALREENEALRAENARLKSRGGIQ